MTEWEWDPDAYWPPAGIDTSFAQLDWITPIFSLVETVWSVLSLITEWECRHIPELEDDDED